MRGVVTEVEPTDEIAIRNAILAFIRQPPTKNACCESVRQFTWEAVAEQIHQCYEEVLAQKARVC